MSLAADDLDEMSPPAPRTSRLIPIGDWRPIGVDDLKPAAWEALQDTGNVAVVARPGAGKTEFLSQRAGYLLQIGICPWPQRILAISFKRDAAANLGHKVTARVNRGKSPAAPTAGLTAMVLTRPQQPTARRGATDWRRRPRACRQPVRGHPFPCLRP
jgi:hypothetical protein